MLNERPLITLNLCKLLVNHYPALILLLAFPPDELSRSLAVDATHRQKQAHRPGTIKGRDSAVRRFLEFCATTGLDYRRLKYFHICWYVEYMARQGSAPASISNTISHLRTYYQLAELPLQPLHHFRVGLALKAIATTIRHVPAHREPVSPELLKTAMARYYLMQSPEATRLALILMFMGFLRQSSVAPQSVNAYDPTRHLSSEDVTLIQAGISLNIKWTKTLQASADATHIVLPPTEDRSVCPVNAYREYQALSSSTPQKGAPLLTHKDGNTLTVPFIRRQWSYLLRQVGADPAHYSLHSLRKGAATFTYNVARADLNDVMNYGTWRSQAVRAYIKPSQGPTNTVYQALQSI